MLTDAQTLWINAAHVRVCDLLRKTPPNGEDFVAAVTHIIKGEDHWVAWKNDGCPTFARSTTTADIVADVVAEVLAEVMAKAATAASPTRSNVSVGTTMI